MNYLDIKHCNMVNGDGLRTVIWFAGCGHKCKGCFQQHSWDPCAGVPFDENAKRELMSDLSEDWCSGVTFSGGDPLYEANRTGVIALAKEIREKFPDKTQWLYTGFCWNEILADPTMVDVVKYVDVICDGPFVESLRDPLAKWVGSSNQHVIDVKARLRQVSELAETVVAKQ